jgi:hypothetical protein
VVVALVGMVAVVVMVVLAQEAEMVGLPMEIYLLVVWVDLVAMVVVAAMVVVVRVGLVLVFSLKVQLYQMV